MKKQHNTRKKLKAAVIEMLQKNPMQAMNIKSISTAAQISRTSFYANFENMDDLICELHDDFMNGFGFLCKAYSAPSLANTNNLATQLSEYIQKNKPILQFLLYTLGLDLFIDKTSAHALRLLITHCQHSGIILSNAQKYQAEILLRGCIHTIYRLLPECNLTAISNTLQQACQLFSVSLLTEEICTIF